MSLERRLAAEALGTGLLVAMVVGSGIMAERLSGGNVAVALLANSFATGAGLVALILALGSVSAQFNPVVTLAAAAGRVVPWREVPALVAAQCLGGIAGVVTTHVMFGLPLFTASRHERSGPAQLAAEVVATFGLLLVIAGCAGSRTSSLALAVGAYITSAYWFTSSTSFANPAVTLARALSDTFAGIRPADAPGFVMAQLLGASAAVLVSRRLFREEAS
jgi:glycerol uptake facilitator-like aquaporin